MKLIQFFLYEKLIQILNYTADINDMINFSIVKCYMSAFLTMKIKSPNRKN